MGKSITFMTNYSALQGGKINIRVGNYILTKIMAGRFTMDLDAYEPKKGSPEETQKDEMYDDICKLARKDCYLSKWSKILDGNVDVVAFATDKAEIRTNNTVKYDGNIMIFYPTKAAMKKFFGFILVDHMKQVMNEASYEIC